MHEKGEVIHDKIAYKGDRSTLKENSIARTRALIGKLHSVKSDGEALRSK